MNPKRRLAEMPTMPKSRYGIMANYMPKVGARGLDMMFRTATVQTNLDYRDEADMVEDARGARGLQPRDRALRQFPVHRRQAQRLPVGAVRGLARH